ncbi:type IV pilus biogenesis protein PilP [Citrobacter freundii]|uniref:type IV pilus biogenesis protein PilP n=1 Tax=Citrobacter freundii TaxID=546 RepID=UPI001907DFF2|nr:type IV pilus biogenesis protein PilP [Citrobacter freundii]MBJ8931625.1 type IV pilus biogenesis protein PilP [Citrobacter freundii]
MLKVQVNKKIGLLVFALLISSGVIAETQQSTEFLNVPPGATLPPPTTVNPQLSSNASRNDGSGLSQLTEINGRTLIMKAQFEEMKAKYQLEKAIKGEFDDSSMNANNFSQAASMPNVLNAPTADKSMSLDGLPVLLGVYGSNGKLQASLRLSNGTSLSVRPGDTLPGGFRVNSVSVSKVTLVKNGQTYNLGS